MSQPDWERDLLSAAVDNFKEENPHLAKDEYYLKADKSMTIRSFMKGARWAQEKAAAPGEKFFLDALAIVSTVMPTPIEGYRENPQFLLSDLRRLVSELSSLKATEAALREDLLKAARALEVFRKEATRMNNGGEPHPYFLFDVANTTLSELAKLRGEAAGG